MFTLRTLVKMPRPSRVCTSKAAEYLKGVTLQKQCVPFRCHNGAVGRRAQARQKGPTQGWWLKKSAEFLLHMLKVQRVMLNLKV